MLTLAQLLNPPSEDNAVASILEVLDELGFQGTSWQDGSNQLSFVRLLGKTWSKAASVVAKIAAGGYLTMATAGWLDLLGSSFYALDRIQATNTIGQITLSASLASPGATWIAGDIQVADQPQGTNGANSYTIAVSGSLTPGQSGSFQFTADTAGMAANIAPGTTLYLWTPIVGFTATNPALSGSNTWITTPGQDEEIDPRYVLRCIGRWSQLTYGNTDGAYAAWLLAALPAVTRFQVASAPGDATVTLYAATDLGPITGAQQTVIDNYINGITDGVGRRPINDIVNAQPTSTLTTPALAFTVYAQPTVSTTIAASVTQSALNYIGQQPVGGTKLVGNQGFILVDGIEKAASNNAGIVSLNLNQSANIPIADGQIYEPAITVTVILVAPT